MEKLLLIALLFVVGILIGYVGYCAYLIFRYTQKIRIVNPLGQFYNIQAEIGNIYGSSEYCIRNVFGKRYNFKFSNLKEVCQKLDEFVQEAMYYNNRLYQVMFGAKFVKSKKDALEKLHNKLKELQEKIPSEGSN